jgi:curved DNA-binding protein CbpA
MDLNKDYYKILGVLDNAEDIVIKAAYRVLAQKYHPDKNQTKVAKEKMQEINEAYSVLSNPEERKQYDGSRKKHEYTQDNSKDTKDLLDTLDKDWGEIIEFFPKLDKLAKDLSIYSSQLEFTFKVILLDNKEFERGKEIATNLKNNYLEKYFGTNKTIRDFAEELFMLNNKNLLHKLNRAVNLLGSKVNPIVILKKFENDADFIVYKEEKKKARIAVLAKELINDETTPSAINFLTAYKYNIEIKGLLSVKYEISDRKESFLLDAIDLVEFATKKAKSFLNNYE